ncbi:hypothetical protein U9M48_025469 [Paspalum notatum var. saurae]|uniref:Uncharacterized protein n=1 Tax=Paspalum notatum var. saurae TaxID=547442 RepID=A0AAQ3WYC1_PASNO
MVPVTCTRSLTKQSSSFAQIARHNESRCQAKVSVICTRSLCQRQESSSLLPINFSGLAKRTRPPVVCPSSQQFDLLHLLQLSLLELLSSSSTKREAMSVSYPKREEDVNGRKVGMVFKTKKGSPSLVALYNMCTFYLSTFFGVNRDLTEKEIKHIIGDVIKE